MTGFEPGTIRCRSRCSDHWATPAGAVDEAEFLHGPSLRRPSHQSLTKLLELGTSDRLGEDVRQHLISREVLQSDLVGIDCVSNEMDSGINVFRPAVMSGILGKSDGT